LNVAGDNNLITVSSACTADVKPGHYVLSADVTADVPGPSKSDFPPALNGSIIIQYVKFAVKVGVSTSQPHGTPTLNRKILWLAGMPRKRHSVLKSSPNQAKEFHARLRRTSSLALLRSHIERVWKSRKRCGNLAVRLEARPL
jgi:hypothetical protein